MILYAVLGLLFIAMIVLAVLSAKKDWHWLNPVLLVFIFLAGSAAMIAMAQTLHLRRTALKKLNTAEQRVATAEKNRQEMIFGDISSAEYGPNSLRGLSQQVELMQLGRGREWSGGTVENVDGEIKFTFPTEQPENEDANMSLNDVELFAFANDAQNRPVSFVGKFLVVEQTPKELFLKISVPIANWDEYRAPKAATWTLFERMPFDKHGIFRDLYRHLFPEEASLAASDFNIGKFRQFLTTNEFAIPAAKLGMDPASPEYERLIDEVSFDGLSLGTIDAWVDKAPNRQSERFEPTPAEVFIRYKFTGNSNETYTVDDKTGKLDTDGTFSVQGHAVDPLLHLSPGSESRDVSFRKDDIVEIDQRTAEGYQRPDGTQVPPFVDREPNVVVEDRIFRRKLVDFPYEMTNLYNRGFQAETDQQRLASNNEVQDTALQDLLKQQQERTREKIAIENDNNLLRNDLDRVSAILQQRDQQVAENARRIESLEMKLEELRRSIELRAQSISSSSR
ncbi:hypothetical protein [Mariniblastus fucicola]|uniref:Uncharacterized protein n=1 Tax=Mariniblastus fucicola TaxID=980251 RepID=A0A5B9PIF8_9BACT|nr:hypothetical protein [Mariniblastus fucicola]QEG25065.1 hypothetical protein MFFC18_49880 [Mariniblastus fucicola]